MRVQFRDGQILRRQDLENEQHYHIERHRSHNLSHHTFGVVRGLGLQFDETRGVFVVTVGVGVAPDGVRIEMDRNAVMPLSEFNRLGRDRLRVFLYYRLETEGVEGSWPVGSCRRRTAERSGRLNVVGEVRAEREPPGDGGRDKRISLGTMIRDLSDPQKPQYKVDETEREYAGVRAACVCAPSEKARIELGSQFPESYFAVHVAEESEDPNDASGVNQGNGNCGESKSQGHEACDDTNGKVKVLEIRPADESGSSGLRLDIHADTTIVGDCRVLAGALSLGPMPVSTKEEGVGAKSATGPAELEEDSREWSIYRSIKEPNIDIFRLCQEDCCKDRREKEKEKGKKTKPERIDELRIELGKDDGAFAIGWFDAEESAFVRVLEVSEDGVVVNGDLHVDGPVVARTEPGKLPDSLRRNLLTGVISANENAKELLQAFNDKSFSADIYRIEQIVENGEWKIIFAEIKSDKQSAALLKALIDWDKNAKWLEKFLSDDERAKAFVGALRRLEDDSKFARLLEHLIEDDRSPPLIFGVLLANKYVKQLVEALREKRRFVPVFRALQTAFPKGEEMRALADKLGDDAKQWVKALADELG